MLVKSDAELLEVVAALRPPCGLAGTLHRWQQEGDEQADDGDDRQKFDQRETATAWLSMQGGHATTSTEGARRRTHPAIFFDSALAVGIGHLAIGPGRVAGLPRKPTSGDEREGVVTPPTP